MSNKRTQSARLIADLVEEKTGHRPGLHACLNAMDEAQGRYPFEDEPDPVLRRVKRNEAIADKLAQQVQLCTPISLREAAELGEAGCPPRLPIPKSLLPVAQRWVDEGRARITKDGDLQVLDGKGSK